LAIVGAQRKTIDLLDAWTHDVEQNSARGLRLSRGGRCDAADKYG